MNAFGLKGAAAALLLIAGVFAAPCSSADFDTERLQEILRSNDTASAETFVAQELRTISVPVSRALIYNIIGWAYFKMDRLGAAQQYLKSSLEIAEREHDTRTATLAANNLGVLNFAIDDIEQSYFYFNKDYTRDTDIAREYKKLIEAKQTEVLATSALEQGVQLRFEMNFDEAISSYDSALQYQPENAKILEYKGYALFREHKLEEAIGVLKQAQKLDPSREFVYLNLVKAYCSQGSESGIRDTIAQSGLPEQKFADWYQVDPELRRVCQDSETVAKFATGN